MTHLSRRGVQMEYPVKNNISYEEIQNGALILLLLRGNRTWEELCRRYAYADPAVLTNTNTMALRDKLFDMRDLGLITFQDIYDPEGVEVLIEKLSVFIKLHFEL